MLEKTIVTAIMRYLKTIPCCFAWKTHGGIYTTSGIPDIVCCINGYFVAFEVKPPKGRLTKLQEMTIRRINEACGIAHRVTSVADVQAVLEAVNVFGTTTAGKEAVV